MRDYELKGSTVLVTGASGFIGSHTTKRMLREKARVSVLVRESSDLWRLDSVLNNIDVHRADIRDPKGVSDCVGRIRPDYVFHLAAYGVDSRQKDCQLAAATNVMGTLNLLNALGEVGCRKVLNIGSCMEYGNKQEMIREEAVLEPFNIYGSTKAAAGILAHQLARENGLELVTLRAFGIFGEGEGSHKFFPHLILSILSGGQVNLTACEQYRDYCYIDNLMDAFVMAARDPGSKNEIYNFGSGTIHQLKYYVDLVYRQMPGTSRPNYGAIPYRSAEVWKPHPDVGKIKARLGWTPRISVEDGLVRTIDWFAQNLDKYPGGEGESCGM